MVRIKTPGVVCCQRTEAFKHSRCSIQPDSISADTLNTTQSDHKLTCRRWSGSFAPPPRSEPTLFSRRLPWPSLPAHSRTPSRRRQPWYQRRTPPCRPAARLTQWPQRGCCPAASEPLTSPQRWFESCGGGRAAGNISVQRVDLCLLSPLYTVWRTALHLCVCVCVCVRALYLSVCPSLSVTAHFMTSSWRHRTSSRHHAAWAWRVNPIGINTFKASALPHNMADNTDAHDTCVQSIYFWLCK